MNNPNCGRCGMLNHAGFCKLTACIYPCQTGMGSYINKPITNADRIRSMTDEELSESFADYVSCYDCPIPYCKVRFTMERLGCQANWLDWLKQKVEDGE